MGVSRCSSDCARIPSVGRWTICIYIEILEWCMPYDEVTNLVTVTKTNMIDDMPCAYGTLRTTALRIRHQISRRAALDVSHRPVRRSHPLQYLTVLIVKSRSIRNAHPQLQVPSRATENALVESESTLQSSRRAWEHLEVLESSSEGYRSVWEVCVWLPDWFTFCWYWRNARRDILNVTHCIAIPMLVCTQ